MSDKIPRDNSNDYTETMACRRREFISGKTSTPLDHIGHYSVEPGSTAGNIENFFGVAQIPMGLMGPLLVNGEHCLLYTSPSPRDRTRSRMPSSA